MNQTVCMAPISVGELWDKFSILCIKKERILDEQLQSKVLHEIRQLESILQEKELPQDLFYDLKLCNEKLWDIEDSIRKKEHKQEFDEEFIELARSVYITNDQRARIKLSINQLFHSDITEVKSYATY